MKIDAYDLKEAKKTSIETDSEVFGGKENKSLLAQAVRVYRARLRQGNANTKTRGEVAGSTRKIYKQKGTGRARHGSIKAPVFIGGGTVHGPRAHDFDLDLPTSMKRAALLSALSMKAGVVKVLKGVEGFEGKTKDVFEGVNSLVEGEKKILCVIGDANRANFRKSAQNIKRLVTVPAQDLNALEVLSYANLIMEDAAIEILEKRLLKAKKESK
jgi:large subunit ribosomal protein L4